MSKVKFNVVRGRWEWKTPSAKYGMIYQPRAWKTVEDILALNEIQKYARMVARL